MEEGCENAGIVVSIRIKPIESGDTSLSIESPRSNALTVVSSNETSTTYKFDYIHWSTGTPRDTPSYASQETVFCDIGLPLVENARKGFNCSLFAYGQTVTR